MGPYNIRTKKCHYWSQSTNEYEIWNNTFKTKSTKKHLLILILILIRKKYLLSGLSLSAENYDLKYLFWIIRLIKSRGEMHPMLW